MSANAWLSQGSLVLASNNKGKIAEFEKLFEQLALPVEVIPQGQLNIADAIEDGLSFVENAIIKARHAAHISGKPAIADDSGICVPILNGAPGIYSARYAGEHGNDAANNARLLEELKSLRRPGEPVEAMFVCVLALVQHAEDPLPQIFEGVWQGEILEKPRGEHGFGYDPLFWLPELGLSSAELPKEEKNKISHRGQAMQLFQRSLQNHQ
ncbi:RdgB/HAM1 family non-canonical purine NTP pyrophosphatase [Acinetobacter radioresistens]|jgi:XTP/dITP diphosphohydrolase|uniref:RdgB/HAM1 family non-canonical purine NTP pyrophosphatase n=1 Tax=Acinetobacter radioresistens TaxID=40216 RepID=UPI002005B527|nr:RdgB/HAM1 family non-canonical purine NTP pyrophosphatase [Acinetobacter radioresistens]MCK4079959.1 RdgB/HAM1 family non-canonical purine NTP pyrophosphatase [Acinetobacter radioresistens]MCK4086527.1 RdgB/HAM1 family non-canonical purine NTP pyrophosphatase [Acinetobacter radioresistens]MCK4107410.1 RdgB/HAM1 family non-canonical purine NTP pyrophosphatase [Acinetobacter radioresistens]MCU4498591.1 RdgB/HAM1 family non-canonical purine NTP pyrophosphatase [Acinetobacter radioresistens]MCX